MSAPFMLHLMRHGTPVVAGRMLGWSDVAVGAEGIADCVAQAEGLTIERIVSSDLIRARDCAVAIAQDRGMQVDQCARWRELDFGAWDGWLPADLDQEALGRFWDDPNGSPPPGGERWSCLVARVSAAIDDLAPVSTLVVTHGGAIRAALAVLCGFGQREMWAFDLPCGVLVSLKVWPAPERSAQIVGLRE